MPRYISIVLMLMLAAVWFSAYSCSAEPFRVARGNQSSTENLILLIGDGMGPQQIALWKMFVERSQSAQKQNRVSALVEMLKLGTRGLVFPSSADGLVVDSACATTQLATGRLCRSETLGLNEAGEQEESIAERAHRLGKSVGLVTDTRLTHATPAAFASHQKSRDNETAIAEEMIASQFEVLLGGGWQYFIPGHRPGSKRQDERDLLFEAEKAGYQVVDDIIGLERAMGPKVLGLFAPSGMADGITDRDTRDSSDRSEPALAEMSAKALQILEKNPNGFFLMIEGGRIDWAAHQNDAGLMLQELRKFDEAIAVVRQWAKSRPNTTVVMTADHETGSFGLSYSALNIPEPKRIPGTEFAEDPFVPQFNFVPPSALDVLFSQKLSLNGIIMRFEALKVQEQTLPKLIALVHENTGFTIDTAAAQEILLRGPNLFYKEGHGDLDYHEGPMMGSNAAFYPHIRENRGVLLSRAIAPQQGVVWGTGTHTSTPVLVVAEGPKTTQERFNGVFQTADVGKLCREALGIN